ncbi:hypothetical protein LTR53_010644 [Teratosphaeriaceae sp. CCFEE 6253]|nr:hypothetical protein LTR53_010644 [Teratosphaeriaceae sp. CCFEE 6253]
MDMLLYSGICSLLLACSSASPVLRPETSLSTVSRCVTPGALNKNAGFPGRRVTYTIWTVLTGCADATLLQLDNGIAKRSIAGASIGGVNFPDPSILQTEDGRWYAFATRTIGTGVHIQAARSADFETWDIVTNEDGTAYDALPDLPAWIYNVAPNTWAPDVVQIADGTFVMYYSATTASDARFHCVGAATALNVLGPYTASPEPMFCPLDKGGGIDASGFEDAGQRYVVYKVDGNSIGRGGRCGNAHEPFVPTPLILQPVAADGVTLRGGATTLLDHVGSSDEGIVEAPALMKSGSTYFLFFSTGCYMDGRYTLHYATSRSITGPFTRAQLPLLQSDPRGLISPGGADVQADGQHILFHAASPAGTARALYQAKISVSGDVVSIQ